MLKCRVMHCQSQPSHEACLVPKENLQKLAEWKVERLQRSPVGQGHSTLILVLYNAAIIGLWDSKHWPWPHVISTIDNQQAWKLKFRLRNLTSCWYSSATSAVCFKGCVAGADKRETGNKFYQLKFWFTSLIITVHLFLAFPLFPTLSLSLRNLSACLSRAFRLPLLLQSTSFSLSLSPSSRGNCVTAGALRRRQWWGN